MVVRIYFFPVLANYCFLFLFVYDRRHSGEQTVRTSQRINRLEAIPEEMEEKAPGQCLPIRGDWRPLTWPEIEAPRRC
jgi:hypothetical protein